MKARQSPYAHNSAASFNNISLDDEHAAAVTVASPPFSSSSLSNSPRAPPSSSTSRFIETCYNHFFPTSSRVSSNVSLNSGETMTRMASRHNSAESTAIDAPTGGRRRAKLTIAIDADEPYAGLAKLHTPSTPHTADIIQTSPLGSGKNSLDSASRSRSASILSRASLMRSDKPPKLKESVKSANGICHGGTFKRNDSRESNTSRQSPDPVSPTLQNRVGKQDRRTRVAGGSSVEYSPPANSHYSSVFSSNSNSADSSSAVSPAYLTTTASAASTTKAAAPVLTCQDDNSDKGLSRDVNGNNNNTAVVSTEKQDRFMRKKSSVPRSLGMGRMRSYEAEDEFPYYNLECGGAIERRNHYQFAKVLESASTFAALNASITVPFTSLANPGGWGKCMTLSDTKAMTRDDSSVEAAASDADFRRRLCEYSLADEMREALRKYKGTPNLDLRTPDRIFKVVFVGDSGVGKTCFLHRFCHNRFRPLFNATIGVDFIVKTVRIRDRLVAVQLWDTAGQERFRSITKQYFRKADGVVLMYDVTSEQSYLNVRNWIESVRVGVDDECVMCLIGNKVDLYPNEECRTITYTHGADLANEFDMIFFETSAYTGLGINDSMRALAFRLQQREEEHLAEAIRLEKGLANGLRSQYCYCL